MTHSVLPRFGATMIGLSLSACISCWSTACFAEAGKAPTPTAAQPILPSVSPSASYTARLTDEERNAILNRTTEESAAAARGELLTSDGTVRGVHGEVGVMIGTNGMRSAYGTAAVPLGDNAGAVVSFETSRYRGDRRQPPAR